jgi:hypothetical protein
MADGLTKCHLPECDLKTSIMRRPWPTRADSLKNAKKHTWDNKYLRQEIASENLFVLFIFCDPTDNFDVSRESCIFTFADLGEAATLPLNPLNAELNPIC